jgi:hypothetical protein
MSVDESWKGVYKAGGVSFVAAGILFILSFVLSFAQGQPPSTIEETLNSIAGQKLLFQATNGLFILVDILSIPAMLALYLALKEVKRTHALISTAMGLLGIVLAVGLRTGVHAMVALSSAYVAATSETQRAAYLAAADLVSGATDPGLTLANLLLFVYTLIISIAMLAGVFGRGAAYLGLVTGILGIVGLVGSIFIPALSMMTLLAALGWAIWFLVVGIRLYRL